MTNRERIISTIRLYVLAAYDDIITVNQMLENVDKTLDRVWGLAVAGISLDEPIIEAAPYPFPREIKDDEKGL